MERDEAGGGSAAEVGEARGRPTTVRAGAAAGEEMRGGEGGPGEGEKPGGQIRLSSASRSIALSRSRCIRAIIRGKGGVGIGVATLPDNQRDYQTKSR